MKPSEGRRNLRKDGEAFGRTKKPSEGGRDKIPLLRGGGRSPTGWILLFSSILSTLAKCATSEDVETSTFADFKGRKREDKRKAKMRFASQVKSISHTMSKKP